ncbi:MAG TPA: phosphopantetheine-binding protein [Mycobacteriales bacterium]|jgi:acyl carrier protein|nr:phosphopantetheine-binding protein [Mycobacteriales bacterium]
MRDHESLVIGTIREMVERRTGTTANITLDSDMIADLEMDSLEIAELSAVLEEEYGEDPYTAGTLARTPREVLAFYQPASTA